MMREETQHILRLLYKLGVMLAASEPGQQELPLELNNMPQKKRPYLVQKTLGINQFCLLISSVALHWQWGKWHVPVASVMEEMGLEFRPHCKPDALSHSQLPAIQGEEGPGARAGERDDRAWHGPGEVHQLFCNLTVLFLKDDENGLCCIIKFQFQYLENV